jgi:hypothetical protein
MQNITIDWGHKYGKPFGFREIRAMMKKVAQGEYEEVRRNAWSVRGENGGLQHGFEATFRKIVIDL